MLFIEGPLYMHEIEHRGLEDYGLPEGVNNSLMKIEGEMPQQGDRH